MPDVRVLHSLPEVLRVALCAMVSDCEDFTDMGHFAQSQLAWLREFMPLRNGAPSHEVLRNVFHALLEIMELWVGELDGSQVTIEGKGGHPDIARQIQDKGADYILALKANEKEAHQDVIAHFEAQRTATEETHDQGGWVQGSEVSMTCEQNRGR